MIKTRRYKRLVFGFVFCTWNWYDFWRRSWGLPCSRPLLPTRCWFVWRWCVSTLEQRSWRRCMGGLKTGPSRRHRIQPAEGPFLDPRAKETCFKKGQKVARLKSKVVPPGGSSFGPFLAPSMWQICWGVYFKSKLIWPATAAAGILNWGGPFLRACFFLCFEVQKRAPSLSYCFAPISIALRPSRPAAKPALTCFVLISMVLRHWSSRLALRPASNFVSSYNFFWFAAISITLRPWGLPWGRPFAPAAA